MKKKLEGKSWAFVMADNWKIQLCPVWLLDDLVQDMEKRNGPIKVGSAEGIDKVWWDPGGMIMQDRSHQTMELDSATLSVASQDFELFLRKLEALPLRTFDSGKGYYKLHGWPCHCLVLSVEQRDLVLKEGKARLEMVKKVAEAEDEEFQRRLDRINSGGLKIISAKDKNIEIVEKDGKIAVSAKLPIEGPLGGIPSNAKN